jgi:DNA-binding SARP family transcriptional activator
MGPLASETVRLHLLSDFALLVHGVAVPVAGHAQRVLAYLATQPRAQPRSHVAAALWLDVPPRRATANLRSALWRLGDVREHVLRDYDGRIGLAADVEVDVPSMQARARYWLDHDPRHQRPRTSPTAALPPDEPDDDGGRRRLPDVTADLDVLSRDLLPGWDEDWLVFQRERLRQLRLHALEAMCSHLRWEGRHAEAVEAGLAAVTTDPLRESAQRELIESYLAEGNRVEAARQLERFRRLLRAELGVAPSAQLQRLVTE